MFNIWVVAQIENVFLCLTTFVSLLNAKPKRLRDFALRPKLIVDIVNGARANSNPDKNKNPDAVALGRLGD